MNPLKNLFVKFFTRENGRSTHSDQKALCIRGYHIYKDIWEAAVGETLACVLVSNNCMASLTVSLAAAIVDTGIHADSSPRGSGNPSAV